MRYKQCSVKAGRRLSLFLSPTLVISEWVYLSALVVRPSLRPSAIISLGCGKVGNPWLAIGWREARDGIVGSRLENVLFARPAGRGRSVETFSYDFTAKAMELIAVDPGSGGGSTQILYSSNSTNTLCKNTLLKVLHWFFCIVYSIT